MQNCSTENMAVYIRDLLKFCVLVVSILTVNAQWAIEDDNCRTPDDDIGNCISIYSCKPIMDILDTRPMSSKVTELLKAYHCGYDGKTPKVCCPSKPIDTNMKNTDIEPPNVDKHRNINLLPTECGILPTGDRIINGNKTGLFEYPWMALLSYTTKRGPDFRCGGTIINDKYILTAAHCVTNLNAPLLGVRVGEHDLRTDIDCETDEDGEEICAPPFKDLAIEKIIPHPEYNKKLHTNDIGLLRVTKMDLNLENIKPVCMPLGKTRNYNYTGRNVLVTGFGATETGRSSPELLQVSIPSTEQAECVKTYADIANTVVTHRQMCAGGKTTSDSCSGDSGGPLQIIAALNGDSRMIQQGIVSFGPKDCGRQGLPGVYTRVAYYMDWILDNLKL